MPSNTLHAASDDEIDLVELGGALWKAKWLIAAVTVLFAAAGVAYALMATEMYRADTLLAPTEESSGLSVGGQLGGLAELAGFSLGRGNGAEAVAIVKSREFVRSFIEDKNLLPVLYEDAWDADNGRWLAADPTDWPDMRDAVTLFQEGILTVQEDRGTGQVTLAIEWKEPETAASWANELVNRLNQRMRQRALTEAQANIDYLQEQLGATSLVVLQDTIGRLLENELQKAMLARGNQEYSFRVLDRAVPPKQRHWPKRTLVVIIATLVGGILSTLVVTIQHTSRKRSTPNAESSGSMPLKSSPPL